MPVQGSLPCRTVAGAARARCARPAAEVDPRRTQRRARRYAFRARTRGGGRGAPRCGLFFKPGEDALRTARLSALFRSDLRLIHFSLDLLRQVGMRPSRTLSPTLKEPRSVRKT